MNLSGHRSVSQIKQYEQCPYAYKLARIDKVWERPAAWLPHGTAVHAAIEAWEKSGRTMSLEATQQVFREEYAKGINELCERTPNFNYWFSSGPYRGEADAERRFGIGLAMVEKYIKWATGHPEEVIWVADDGTPGVEIGFDFDLDGVRMRGYIDLVLWDLVRDVKTGALPGDTFQLAVYGVALEEQYGHKVSRGDYWMGKTGKPTVPYNLADISRQEIVDRVHAADEGIRAEKFDPKPSPDNCGRCTVATSCPFAL